MTSQTGIDIREGQRWKCVGGNTVEIVCVRKAPTGSVRMDVVGGYIAAAHKLVEMEPDDFVSLIANDSAQARARSAAE